MRAFKNSGKPSIHTLNCCGKLLNIYRPLVMGIINVTPDSFYAGSREQQADQVVLKVQKMLEDGADLIDIGGQSTRPGSQRISAEEECQRVEPVISAIKKKFPDLLISIDTYYAAVAREALRAGASIINDVSAGTFDTHLPTVAAEFGAPYIVMHMQGTPETMQHQPTYQNITLEILDYLIARINRLQQQGVTDLIVDPGFGFGKTTEHNFELLNNLDLFSITGKPVLAGLSRKGMIYKTLGIDPEEALNGTTALNMVALLKGVSILRVHDVKEAREACLLAQQLQKKSAL